MFRVIHPNRWFFWTIGALIIAGFVVMVFLQRTILEMNQHSAEIANTAPQWIDPRYPGWHSFRPENFGLSVKYPPGWQVEIDRLDANTVSIENSKDFEENITITVTAPKNEKLIRQSLDVKSEEPILIDGEKGAWLRGSDARDKATANAVLIKRNDKLYSIAGSAAQFEKIIKSIKFINE